MDQTVGVSPPQPAKQWVAGAGAGDPQTSGRGCPFFSQASSHFHIPRWSLSPPTFHPLQSVQLNTGRPQRGHRSASFCAHLEAEGLRQAFQSLFSHLKGCQVVLPGAFLGWDRWDRFMSPVKGDGFCVANAAAC